MTDKQLERGLKLYIASSGDYDMEQFAVIAPSKEQAMELFKRKIGCCSTKYYTKNIREYKCFQVAKIENGD